MRKPTEHRPLATPTTAGALPRSDIVVALALLAGVAGFVACGSTAPVAEGGVAGAAGAKGPGSAGAFGEAGTISAPGAAGTTGAAGAAAGANGAAGAAGVGDDGGPPVMTGGSGASGNGQQSYCTFDYLYTFTAPSGQGGAFQRDDEWGFDAIQPSCLFAYKGNCGSNQLCEYTIMQDVHDPDVDLGLSIGLYAAVYGDPTVGKPWKFGRGPNEQMTVYKGTDCSSGKCKPIPAGIARLIDDLDKLVTTILARPGCQPGGLGPPGGI